MVCVAWSEGFLTPEASRTLTGLLETQSWLDDESRELICAWLDPDIPPTPDAIASLRGFILEMWPDDRLVPKTLAGLGLELVRASGLIGGPWSDDDAPGRLSEAEAELGVQAPEAISGLLGARRRKR
jgi:hypothetical protein